MLVSKQLNIKKMKTKIIASILFGALALGFFACSKDQNVSSTLNEAKNELQKAVFKMSIPELNSEGSRIYDDLMGADKLFSIIHISNHGETQSFEMTGSTDEATDMILNGGNLRSPNVGLSWWQAVEQDEINFGASNSVIVKNGSVNDTLTFYVPDQIFLSALSDDINLDVSNGVNLEWNADTNNPTDLVLVYLTLYDDYTNMNELDRIHLLTEDDGQFDITSELQDTSVGMIKIVIVRGNGKLVSDPHADLFVNIRSQDEHQYLLTH